MIAYIKGTIAYTESDHVVIDHDGIGYLVRTPSTAAEKLKQGNELTLYTYMYVREDAISLYGFLSREDRTVFELLIGVSGIGPKVALAILSAMTVEELYYAVFSEDFKTISKTPGIGPKGAKRLVIELKDKLKLEDLQSVDLAETDHPSEGDVVQGTQSQEVQDAIDALIALGYSGAKAYKAVHEVAGYESMTSDLLLKSALKYLL